MKPSTKLLGERTISGTKVSDYLLNLGHPEGGGKAKFFVDHGFAAQSPDVLASALDDHAVLNEVSEVIPGNYGTKTLVRCSIQTPDGRNPCILTVWIREDGSSQQRLVTAYPFGT